MSKASSLEATRAARASGARVPALLGALCALVCLAPRVGAAPGIEPGPGSPVSIDIASPQPGEVIKNKVDMAPVRGAAHAGGEGSLDFDVMLALDISKSTRYPSGIDVDGDGETGFDPHRELIAPGTYPDDVVCTDPDDTILAAEVHAARKLLEVLDPRRSRVGIITFSGEVDPATGKRARFDQQDAWLEAPLTSDFAEVRRTLDAILARGPYGATNFAAGVRLAVTELAGLSGARSEPRPDRKKVLLFLTDGIPTFPFGRSSVQDPGDTEAAVSAARLARKAGVTINTYALGSQALAYPLAVTEMARVTVGVYTPIQNPGDIVSFLQGVSFANVEDVVITNLTTREVSYDVHLAPDGSFSGFVPVREGRNLIQVTALASDGSEAAVQFPMEFERSGLTERELAIELERIKNRNKELMLLLERERIRRFRERQKGRVEITPEEP